METVTVSWGVLTAQHCKSTCNKIHSSRKGEAGCSFCLMECWKVGLGFAMGECCLGWSFLGGFLGGGLVWQHLLCIIFHLVYLRQMEKKKRQISPVLSLVSVSRSSSVLYKGLAHTMCQHLPRRAAQGTCYHLAALDRLRAEDDMDGISAASLLQIKLPLWLGEITAAWYTL